MSSQPIEHDRAESSMIALVRRGAEEEEGIAHRWINWVASGQISPCTCSWFLDRHLLAGCIRHTEIYKAIMP